MLEKWANKILDNMYGDDIRFLLSITPYMPFVGKTLKSLIDAHWAQRVADAEAFVEKLYGKD